MEENKTIILVEIKQSLKLVSIQNSSIKYMLQEYHPQLVGSANDSKLCMYEIAWSYLFWSLLFLPEF